MLFFSPSPNSPLFPDVTYSFVVHTAWWGRGCHKLSSCIACIYLLLCSSDRILWCNTRDYKYHCPLGSHLAYGVVPAIKIPASWLQDRHSHPNTPNSISLSVLLLLLFVYHIWFFLIAPRHVLPSTALFISYKVDSGRTALCTIELSAVMSLFRTCTVALRMWKVLLWNWIIKLIFFVWMRCYAPGCA